MGVGATVCLRDSYCELCFSAAVTGLRMQRRRKLPVHLSVSHRPVRTCTRFADAAEEHAAVQDEGAGLPVLDNMQAQVEPEKLLEPVWQLGDERCPLLVLQVTAARSAGTQPRKNVVMLRCR